MRPVRCTDHKGREYPSMRKMAEAHGVGRVTLANRLSAGMSLAEALTTPTQNVERLTDPMGREWASITALASAYGLSRQVVRYRLARGMSLRNALRPVTRKVEVRSE